MTLALPHFSGHWTRSDAFWSIMSDDVYDFRIAKLQRYIRKCHAEGRPVPSAYAAIEHNLDHGSIRDWLAGRDANTEKLKELIRTIAAMPDDEDEDL
jgi:hypothetical protein